MVRRGKMKMRRPPIKKLLVFLFFVVVISTWVSSVRYMDFDTVQRWTWQIQSTAVDHAILTFFLLICAQAIGMLFTLPTKAILNMVGSALLGFTLGASLTMIGTLLGTTGLFFITRKLIQPDSMDLIPKKIKRYEQKLKHRPTLTIASLRMILALPYGSVTIFAAISQVPFRSFFVGSFLGDIPVVVIYSLAGIKLAQFAGKREAVSVESIIFISLVGIAMFAGSLLFEKKASQKTKNISLSKEEKDGKLPH